MMLRKEFLCGVVLAVALASAPIARANLIVNHSFESNSLGTFHSYNVGDPFMAPWDITFGLVTLVNATYIYGPAADGDQYLSLQN